MRRWASGLTFELLAVDLPESLPGKPLGAARVAHCTWTGCRENRHSDVFRP